MMKKQLLYAFILLGSSAFIQAQDLGELSFETKSISLGEIPFNKDTLATYRFENTGNREVEIKHITITGDCKIVYKPTKAIQPGEKSKIVVKYDTSIAGPIRKTISIHSDASQPNVALKLTGKVLPEN
ncbi:hypothetical protein CAP47_00805 [Psychroflexus sp. S27]|nr:hypothetical protein CAP47_00805 [Psychroflexus sp. S27]